jgi:hypothetical protein
VGKEENDFPLLFVMTETSDIYGTIENFLKNNNDNYLFIVITIYHPRNRLWRPIGL